MPPYLSGSIRPWGAISPQQPPRPSSSLRPFNSSARIDPSVDTIPFASLRITDNNRDTPLLTPDRSRPLRGGRNSSNRTSTASTSTATANDIFNWRTPRRWPPGPPRMVPLEDVFLTCDLPTGFTVGYDNTSFQVTSRPFPGFRGIPAGAHLIWAAASAAATTRGGFWIFTPPRAPAAPAEVYVKQWHSFDEELGAPLNASEGRWQRNQLHRIFDRLMPCDTLSQGQGQGTTTNHLFSTLPDFLQEGPALWERLTWAIRPRVPTALTGLAGAKTGWRVSTTDEVAGQALNFASPDTAPLRFAFSMDEQLISATATGEARTRQALDPTSFVIEKLEGGDNNNDNDDNGSGAAAGDHPNLLQLVGELSFAFLTGRHLGNMSCIEQWWFYLTRIIFRCYALAEERPRLVLQLIQTFHAQLVYEERELDGESVLDQFPEQARALRRHLITYKARLEEQQAAWSSPSSLYDNIRYRLADPRLDLRAAFADLEGWLVRHRGWDLNAGYVRSGAYTLEDGESVQLELSDFEDEDERGDYAPAVVELDDHGRERGRYLWSE
ncbi:AAR2 protein-domain-containing protein [Hypoxylon rubiginosum]|uniref:AAR2 protein-domain-containing protein n=1 Tax=Hypoxylon rubiginosum TaxID=110542 RepID=A0ACC0DII5_9PEZI|nr:AAR2 protein-domain-containing protein [Hypoxylon rubiginosum]